ncbi:MAG: cadherin-like domain-containing protein, partial [Alphaproteobacteria bacterium]|nr:cadherin-like domain-containing protein [Alphaproteobacteria bacterium]
MAPVIDDAASENSETVHVNLSNAVNASIADGQGTATIVDNDIPVYDIQITSNVLSPNLYNLATAAGWNGVSAAHINFNIASGIRVGDITTNYSWGAADISLINNGTIMGMGGAASTGDGYAGHDAISVSTSMSIEINGNIVGGGGSGGGEPTNTRYSGTGAGYQNNGVAGVGDAGAITSGNGYTWFGTDSYVDEISWSRSYGACGNGGALRTIGQSTTSTPSTYIETHSGQPQFNVNTTSYGYSGGAAGKDINMSGNGAQTLTVTSNYTGDIYINADAVDTVRVNNDGDSWSNLGTTSFNGFTYTHYRDAVSHDLFITGGATVRFIGVSISAGLTVASSEDEIRTVLASDLLATGSSVEGDVLSLSSVSNASHGTVALDVNGNVVFTPDANYV